MCIGARPIFVPYPTSSSTQAIKTQGRESAAPWTVSAANVRSPDTAAAQGGVAQAKGAQERQGDPGAADQQVLPGGLKGARGAVEMQERHGREGHGLGRDPEQPEVPGLVAGAQKAEHGQQRRHEPPIGTPRADPQVGDAVNRARQKQQRNRRQHGARQRIEGKPSRPAKRPADRPASRRRGGCAPGDTGQQPRPGPFARPDGREQRPGQRPENQEQLFHS